MKGKNVVVNKYLMIVGKTKRPKNINFVSDKNPKTLGKTTLNVVLSSRI